MEFEKDLPKQQAIALLRQLADALDSDTATAKVADFKAFLLKFNTNFNTLREREAT